MAESKPGTATAAKDSAPKAREPRPAQTLIADVAPRSPAAEAYRTLNANIRFANLDRACRTILVTSATAGEGKTTTAANFAVASALGETRVCLVDADLRRSSVHRVFGLPNARGLTTALVGGLGYKEVAHQTRFPNLSVITSGPIPPNPSETVGSQRMRDFVGTIAEEFDIVVLDSPPVISVSDSVMLAAACDGTILVVRTGKIAPEVARRVTSQIEAVKGRILGVVLNSVNMRRDGYYYDYYRHYSAYYGNGARKS